MTRPDDDPNVIAAIRAGRHADDIWLIDCPICNTPSYWNQGSHATCANEKCGVDISYATDEAYTLEDFWFYSPYPCDISKGPRP